MASNILRLRIVEKDRIDSGTLIVDTLENQEKQKNKRGRPRKQTQDQLTSAVVPTSTTTPTPIATTVPTSTAVSTSTVVVSDQPIVPKKRGRKRKVDQNEDFVKNPNETMIIVKNYIVQLKIKSSDLEKIQTQFIKKSQKIGYDDVRQIPHDGEEDDKSNGTDYREYYNLLNRLELPLVTVPHQISEQILPQIPNVYQNLVIPILPENVPIKLFDESQLQTTQGQNILRNTSELLLPLLDNNKGTWPEKSPYACWNCDTYFTGTPIGIPDKEVDHNFYCYGNFCSFECAARYLSIHDNNSDFWNKYSLLCTIYQKAYNLSPETKVPIAPPKEALSKYGGKLSYETYHNIAQHDHTVEIYKLPLIPVLLHIGEMSRSTNINNLIQNNKPTQLPEKPLKNRKIIPIDPQKITQAEENIKHKTFARLQSTYTLDNCLHRTATTTPSCNLKDP